MGSLRPFRLMRHAIREYRNAVPKLFQLSSREWRDMLAAQLALITSQVRVWTAPKGSLVNASGQETSSTSQSASDLPRARQLALAVSRAASFGVFRPACLVRSLALCGLMERRGLLDAEVRIGVVKRGGHFHAHAWVEYAGEILGDDPLRISDYETLPGVNVLHAD